MRNNIFQIASIWLFLLGVCVASGRDTARTGEAVVVEVAGRVQARVLTGPVHEGRTEVKNLFSGAAVGERAQIMTDRNGHCCLVLTPGALIHVGPHSALTIEEIRVSSTGLPRSEADLVRRVVIRLDRGRIYVNAGVPTPSFELEVIMPEGRIVSNGGIFSVAQAEQGWSVVQERYEVNVLTEAGDSLELSEGNAALLHSRGVSEDDDPPTWLHRFVLCRDIFRDIEPFFHVVRGYDRAGIAQYLGLDGPPIYLGAQGLIVDVSPAFRLPVAATAAPIVPAPLTVGDGRRWSEDRIWRWWDDVGVIRGVNYIQSTAVNSTEMWMEETFDLDVIDEELALAQAAGYTAVRVILQHAVWNADPDGFLDRLDEFLGVAADNGLSVVPVLFDDLNRAGTDPQVGPQGDPIPDAHNARWTPSPGRSAVSDENRWPRLQEYVEAVVGQLKRDRRVLYWDVYNTAGNDGLWEESLPLMDQAIDWVRDVNPRQPLAVPAWRDFGSPMSARKLERSDLITFHTFENAEVVAAQLRLMLRFNRPVVVSDWLMRQRESNFEEILPIFANYGAGWFNRGLVQGRTQMWIQDDAHRDPEQPDVWQHDVFTQDREAYDEREIELIRAFRYLDGR